MVLTLRLLRHGPTEWTDDRRYCGHRDVELSAAGRRTVLQTELPAADYVSVVSSDLLRCRETAELLGFVPALDPALREFDFGRIEGHTWDQLDRSTQDALATYDGFVAPGGESVATFGRRVDAFVDSLAPGHHLVITHGGVIRHLLRREGIERHVGAGEWIDLEFNRR